MSQFDDKRPGPRKTVYFRVKGLVQGVFFRASTKSMAENIGISGWVKNRADGDVEGMATGSDKQLAEFKDWLDRGPQFSKVSSVEIRPVDLEEHTGFEIH